MRPGDRVTRGATPTTVRWLTAGYLLALSMVACGLMAGSMLIRDELAESTRDSRLVNVSGRQRMLSQHIAALTFALGSDATGAGHDTGQDRGATLRALTAATDEFEASQRALRNGELGGDPSRMKDLYAEVDEHHQALVDAARRVLANPDAAAREGDTVFGQAGSFLAGMDGVVQRYDEDARARVEHVRARILWVRVVMLCILVLEALFIFRPLVRNIRDKILRLQETQRALEASLHEQRKLEEGLMNAADRERRRLGEDLHDGLCQQLVGVSYMLRSLQNKVGAPHDARVGEAAAFVEGAVEEARRMAEGLHPIGVEKRGLPSALEQLGEAISSVYDLPCEVRCDEVGDIPSNVTVQLFRIAQEALSNAAKHASARRIEVFARRREGELELDIADDGVGIAAAPRVSMGIHSMRSRASMIGASLQVLPAAGGGTRVLCRVPLNRHVDREAP